MLKTLKILMFKFFLLMQMFDQGLFTKYSILELLVPGITTKPSQHLCSQTQHFIYVLRLISHKHSVLKHFLKAK